MKRIRFLKKKRYISLFTKSVVALILIGVLPLVLMGVSIYNTYKIVILVRIKKMQLSQKC